VKECNRPFVQTLAPTATVAWALQRARSAALVLVSWYFATYSLSAIEHQNTKMIEI